MTDELSVPGKIESKYLRGLPKEIADGLHTLIIIAISRKEFHVSCQNAKCDFDKTAPTRLLAKSACFDHLKEVIRAVDQSLTDVS